MLKKHFVFSITTLLVLSLFSSILVATVDSQQVESQMVTLSESTAVLPFDPNDYNFLVYVPLGAQDKIENAMEQLGIPLDPNDDIRKISNPVTANDLASHDILIVGWNYNGNTNGLSSSVLDNGITGRIVLSGNDLDYHTIEGPSYAQTTLIQAIDYVLQGGGTGFIALGCTDSFPYLPSSWGVSASYFESETVTEFTYEGLETGIFDGLEPEDFCDWEVSNHNRFTIGTNSTFVPLELGGDDGTDIVTVANINIYDLTLTKSATLDPNLSCVSPDDFIDYTITWSCPSTSASPGNLVLIDKLPLSVYFEQEVGTSDGVYNLFENTVTWTFSNVQPGDQATRTIRVSVNDFADPASDIINRVSLFNDQGLQISTTSTTPLCCWGGDTIYVNADADPYSYNTGTSWDEAYHNLADALARAARGCGDEIWIAKGTYIPGDNANDTFTVPDDITIYGGFAGDETTLSQRDIINNPTILSGDDICDQTVTIADALTGVTLDGLIFTNAVNNNLSISDSDVDMTDCWVVNSASKGITSTDSDLTVNRCVIEYNGDDGIYCPLSTDPFDGSFIGTGTLAVANAMIADNGATGIHCYGTVPTVKNSFIRRNGWPYDWELTAHGIMLDDITNPATIRNNTIAYNQDRGIYSSDTTTHDIRNCIIWHNDLLSGNLNQLYNCSTNYSCVTNPADPNGGTSTPDANGNITAVPGFAYFNSWTNFHLTSTSPCVNAGDPTTTGTGETDIDGHDRVCNTYVDMGADEYYCASQVNHDYDFNGDGIINLHEFAPFNPAWLSDPNSDPNGPIWNAALDFNDDDSVDMIDLSMLIEDWLWQACYWTDTWDQLNRSFVSPSAAPAAATEALAMSADDLQEAAEYRVASQRPQELTLQDVYWLWGKILDSVINEFDSGQYSLTKEEMINLIEAIYDIMDDIEKEWLQQQQLSEQSS